MGFVDFRGFSFWGIFMMSRFKRSKCSSQSKFAFRRCVASLSILLQISPLTVPLAQAQTSGSSLASSTIPTSLPASFSMAPAVSFGGLGGCSSPIQSALSQVGSLFSGGAAGIGTGAVDASGCPTPTQVDVPSDCALMTPQLQAALTQSAATNVAAYSCKKAKLDSISTALTCITTAAGQINTQIGALQGHFAGMYQNASQIATAFKEQLDLTAQKSESVVERMEELQQAEERTNELLATINTQITQSRQSVEQIRLQRSELDRATSLLPAAHAQQCFRETTFSQYRCSTSSRDSAEARAGTTPLNAMLCLYEQNMRTTTTSAGARVSTSVSARTDAENARIQLEGALNSILSQMPTQTALPSNPEGLTSSMSQPSELDSIEDILARSEALSSLPTTAGFNPRSAFEQMMRYCYQVGERRAREQVRSGDVRRAREAIDSQEQTIQSNLATQLDSFTRQFEQNAASLSTNYGAIDRRSCENAPLGSTVGCLTSMKNALDAQLRGGAGEGEQVLRLTSGSTVGADIDDIRCRGLSGCRQQLLNKQRELRDRTAGLTRERDRFVSTVNTQMQSQVSAVLTSNPQLQMANQQLQSELASLNAQLGALGVSPGIEIKTVESPGRLEPDENGIMQPPENVLAYVGSQMSPPLLDISSGFLSDSMGGVASKAQEIEQLLAEARGQSGQISARLASCRSSAATAAAGEIRGLVSQLEGCEFLEQGHCNVGDDAVQSLLSDLTRLSSSGVPSTDISRIRTGIENSCPADQAELSGGSAPAATRLTRCSQVFREIESTVGRLRSSGDSSTGSAARSGD